MKNKKGIVYTITNKETKETYIGITTISIHQRKLDHIERAKRGEKGKLFKSLATFKIEAFEFNEIDATYSIDELAEKEKMYIKQYHEKGLSLNSDQGGGFKKSVYKYDLNGNLIAKFECLDDAAKTVNSSKQSISRACLNVNHIYKGFIWSYKLNEPFELGDDKRCKKVYQFDVDGKFIKSYNSISTACNETKINKTSIAKVCRGERNTAGGFVWKYE